MQRGDCEFVAARVRMPHGIRGNPDVVWGTKASVQDEQLLLDMVPLLEAMWKPMRFLTDLRAIWPQLSDKERAEIEAASAFRERVHEKRVQAYAAELRDLASQMRGQRCRELKQDVVAFVDEWDTQEPDRIRVLTALMKLQCGE